ncbi:hypothetical protein D3C87_79210 [compost metagenome]
MKNHLSLQFIPCHRMKSRSYIIFGKQFPICARCTSILLGYLTIPILFCLDVKLPLMLGISLNLPMIIDGYTQLKKLRKSNNFLRTVTGLLSGFGQAIIIIWCSKILFDILIKL